MTDQSTAQFIRVCALQELPEVGAALAVINDKKICIARDSAGDVHAFDDTCTHENISLSEGEVEGETIECWLHGSRFNMRTGEAISLPATVPVAVYPVKIDGDDVYVSVPN